MTPTVTTGHEPEWGRVKAALAGLARGDFVVLVGSRGEAAEGHLVIAADHVSATAVNFMSTHARGVIALALPASRCDDLELRPLAPSAANLYGASVRDLIEAREGVTTGISATDRAHTIAVASRADTRPRDLVRPGHVVTLAAHPRGVLQRAGRSEAAVDLATMAGLTPAAAVCEVLNAAGDVAGRDELQEFGRHHGLPLIEIDEILAYRFATTPLVELTSSVRLPTPYGEFKAVAFTEVAGAGVHLALVRGDVRGAHPTPVALHGECPTGDVFGATNCACADELDAALARVGNAERGVLVYLTESPRGERLLAALHGHERREETVRFGATPRVPSAGIAARIVAALGVTDVVLLTDSPSDFPHGAFAAAGLTVVGTEPLLSKRR